MDSEISKSIQRYQSIVLLDLLIEFREDFVRRILSRWLRAVSMPEAYEKSSYETAIENFFGQPRDDFAVTCIRSFEEWRRGMGVEADSGDADFAVFAKEVQHTLHLLRQEFDTFLKIVPCAEALDDDAQNPYASATDEPKNNLDRIRERAFVRNPNNRAKVRRIGLAVDAFIRTPQFLQYLHPRPGNGTFGLLAIFNLVLLSVDYANKETIPSDDNVVRFTGGSFRFVLPPPELLFEGGASAEDGRYNFQTFFPLVTSKASAAELEATLIDSTVDCKCNVDQSRCFSEATPAIFRGANTFVYDTRYAKALFDKRSGSGTISHKAWTIHRNVNFVQLLPSPHLEMHGYFQLQSSLPGLVRALFPPEECSDNWQRLYRLDNGAITTEAPSAWLHDKAVLIEVPRAREALPQHVNSAGGSGKVRLEAIYWIQHSNTLWSQRFYNQMRHFEDLGKKLWNTIEPRINEAYRKQLTSLLSPIDQMLTSVITLQRVTSEVSAIVKDPSDAVFGIHHLIPRLFDDSDPALRVTKDFVAQIKHEPTDYENTEEGQKSLRSVMAVLLLRWTGVHDDTSTLTYDELLSKATARLRDCALAESFPWTELIPRIQQILMRPHPNTNKHICIAPTSATAIENLLHPAYCFEALKYSAFAAKTVLFTPFKMAADKLGILPIAIALGIEKITVVRNSNTREYHVSDVDILEPEIPFETKRTPIFPKEVIQFLLGISAQAKGRKRSVVVSSATITRTMSSERICICVSFKDAYLDGTAGSLRDRIAEVIKAVEHRDWRIEVGASGNFSTPYMRLATRLMGVGGDWQESDTLCNDTVLGLTSSDKQFRFTVRVKQSEVSISWEKAT